MLIYKEQVHWFLEKDLEEGSRPGRGGGGEGGRAGAEQTPRAAQEAVAGAGVAGQAQQAEEAAGPGRALTQVAGKAARVSQGPRPELAGKMRAELR